MMGPRLAIALWVSAIVHILTSGYSLSADGLAPAEVINQENWQEAEGLVPDQVLAWIRGGRFTLTMGKLEYNFADAVPEYAVEARRVNDGLYDINESRELVEKKTGDLARGVVGHPFPAIDPADPDAATKIMYNGMYSRLIPGNVRTPSMIAHFLDSSGQERELELYFKVASMTGYPEAKNIPNPSDYEQLNIIRVVRPFDLAGSAVMMLRYFGKKPDSNFAYVPAIRRVRRMSPANRSDALFGSDYSQDDSGYTNYDGKIPAFEFKLLRTAEILGAFMGPNPYPQTKNADGEWCAETAAPVVRWGYNEKEYTGLPWTPLNVIFVKRPVYVVECSSTDKWYNYGKQIVWVDREVFVGYYKQTLNRAGEQWKVAFNVWGMGESTDKKYRSSLWPSGVMVDERAQHATVFEFLHEGGPVCQNTKDDLNHYSLGGFQQFCK
ncbi:MAG: outer membrane lipoprotein-sorting protein [bacterium]